MYKYFTILLFGALVSSCSSTNTTNLDYNILLTTFPDYSKSGSYTSYESEIVGYNIETKKYIRFTNDNFEDGNPSCSPDGNRILFYSKRPITGYFTGGAPKRIFILDVTTKDIKQIQTKVFDDNIDEVFIDYTNPIFSPVSNEIVFDMTYLDSTKLVLYDLDTKEIKLAIDVPDIYKIRWSSDGTLIGYEGIHTTRISENSLSMMFELGFINLKNKKKIILEQTKRFSWGLIGGIMGNNNFMIYNSDSINSPINIYEYDVIKNVKKLFTSTNERHPEDCGPTADEILFVKTAENHSQDIWLFNIKTNSFKQLTFDGRYKTDIKYFVK